jgi:superfamily II DNA/RNA helicase
LTIDHLSTSVSFADTGVEPLLVERLAEMGITHPFPIQAMTIPDALAGLDVAGKAKTGSGKTLAFGLPMAQLIGRADPKRPRSLVLVPTRELAAQVAAALAPLLAAKGMSLISVYGGAPMKAQIDALARGVEVVVATPGRLIDLLERKAVTFDDVEIAVVDEADEMADMGFLPQVHHIMARLPETFQTLLFSATLDHRAQALVRSYMTDPVFHNVESETVTVETSEHRFLEIHHMDKPRVVARIAAAIDRTMVFVRTKRGCDEVAFQLRELGVKARAIHGDLPQPKRERMLADFTSGKTPVLVATNVAARGLHIDGVDAVIHYDLPEDSKMYLHRSGRTARAGEAGLVVTFVEWDQLTQARVIQKEAGLWSPIVKMFSNDDRLDNLSIFTPDGERPPPEPKKTRSRRRSRNRLL